VYIEKRISAKGVVSYRVQVRRHGAEISKTFRTKARAREWGVQAEAGLTGESRPLGKHTLADALQRYAKEVSPTKRGKRWEQIRIKALQGEKPSELMRRPLAQVTSDHLGAWRDARLKEVSASTVRREMNLLASVFEQARTEWKWIRSNPMRDVKKPQEPPARRRGVTQAEFAALKARAESPGELEVLAGFELAIETGMRAGEMWGLSRDQIDGPVAHLEKTKNGDKRDVALSPRAIEIIEGLLADREQLFTISNAVRDVLFRRLRDAAGLGDLHFHDSRSEAVSRLSKVLRVQDLADQIGHRDLNSLMLYYRPSATDRARQLAGETQPTKSLPTRSSAAGRHRSKE
jgi:integrase